MAFSIIRGDITKMQADAIVNSANPLPICGGSSDGALYAAAGAEEMLAARKKIGNISPGTAAVTPAFALPAKYVIHTVGPVWTGGGEGERDVLRSCYRHSLRLAQGLNCQSIAFPLISTGTYGFPKDEALDIAVSEIRAFLSVVEMDITLVVFDPASFVLSGQIFDNVKSFIEEREVAEKMAAEYGYGMASAARRERNDGGWKGAGFAAYAAPSANMPSDAAASAKEEPDSRRRRRLGDLFHRRKKESEEDWDEAEELSQGPEPLLRPGEFHARPDADAAMRPPVSGAMFSQPAAAGAPPRPAAGSAPRPKKTLDEAVSHLADTWQESLFYWIDAKGFSETDVYKRANVDRKLFSKIRSNAHYQPKKNTAVAFALALQLNLDETKDLLARAGYALSPSSRFDLIIEYFIENGVYDAYTINLALFEHDEPLLGA